MHITRDNRNGSCVCGLEMKLSWLRRPLTRAARGFLIGLTAIVSIGVVLLPSAYVDELRTPISENAPASVAVREAVANEQPAEQTMTGPMDGMPMRMPMP